MGYWGANRPVFTIKHHGANYHSNVQYQIAIGAFIHIRHGISALGKSKDSYGALLVPIVLGKLPIKIRTNLARIHPTMDDLREAILKEIRVFEAGI